MESLGPRTVRIETVHLSTHVLVANRHIYGIPCGGFHFCSSSDFGGADALPRVVIYSPVAFHGNILSTRFRGRTTLRIEEGPFGKINTVKVETQGCQILVLRIRDVAQPKILLVLFFYPSDPLPISIGPTPESRGGRRSRPLFGKDEMQKNKSYNPRGLTSLVWAVLGPARKRNKDKHQSDALHLSRFCAPMRGGVNYAGQIESSPSRCYFWAFQAGGPASPDRMTCHRMTWMRAPTFSFFHDLSAVYTGAFKASPSARQALSPNDNPSGRVCATRSPTSLACSEVKGTASRTGLSAASHASSGRRPRPTSLPCTSARLTVLIAAPLKSSGVNVSAPGSRLRMASRAEASSTTL